MDREGDSQSSQNSSKKLCAKGHKVDSKGSLMPSFRRGLSSTSQSNYLTRSLPPPHLEGDPALSNRKGGSFDSLIRSYAASLPRHGGSIPFSDFLRMQGRCQLQRADNSTSTCSGYTCMSQEQKMWGQSDDKRELEKKMSAIKDRVEKKLVDEERVVLQQERVEMLERVCKQVQEEESHILDSLRRDIMERMERNIREETKALLAKRRKEIVEKVENAIRAEKLVLEKSHENVLRESHENEESGQEKRFLENVPKAKASIEGSKGQELKTSLLEEQMPITRKEINQKHLVPNERDCTISIEQRKREEAPCHDPHVKKERESEVFFSASCTDAHRGGAQSTQRPTTKNKRDCDEEDGIVRDSLQKLEPELREEKRFEKSFHVQDLRTSLLLKLEVLMKIGTSSD